MKIYQGKLDGENNLQLVEIEEPIQVSPRVRANITTTSKGLVQYDITAESPSVEMTKGLLQQMITEARAVVAAQGMVEAHE